MLDQASELTISLSVCLSSSPQRAPYDLSKLEAAPLKRLDGSEQVVKAGELWKERGAVVMAVRRPG